MKATAKNFKDIPSSQVPAKLKAIHTDLTGIAQFYGQDKDITEAIDSYVSKLNAAAGKAKAAPKRKAKKKGPQRTASQRKAAAAKLETMKGQAKTMAQEWASVSRAQVLAKAQEFNATRTLGAIMIDGSKDHKKRLTPTPENLLRWMKAPGKFDLSGVDNYKKTDSTSDLVISKSIFWNRLGVKI